MNILEEIKTAEQKAVEIRLVAQAEAREIVRGSESAAQAEAAKVVEAAEVAAAKKFEIAAKIIGGKAAMFVAEKAKEDDELIHRAEVNLPDAVAYIVTSAGGSS